jgi:hypothetical protein
MRAVLVAVLLEDELAIAARRPVNSRGGGIDHESVLGKREMLFGETVAISAEKIASGQMRS